MTSVFKSCNFLSLQQFAKFENRIFITNFNWKQFFHLLYFFFFKQKWHLFSKLQFRKSAKIWRIWKPPKNMFLSLYRILTEGQKKCVFGIGLSMSLVVLQTYYTVTELVLWFVRVKPSLYSISTKYQCWIPIVFRIPAGRKQPRIPNRNFTLPPYTHSDRFWYITL